MSLPTPPPVLSVHALGKSYGDTPVLRDVTLEIHAGTATTPPGWRSCPRSRTSRCG